ncbi:hydrogenase maturation protease [Halobacteriovorax sp. GFR7]|uniref:hydrogenase maturation protease n=1 Tax=unclassified Halobacteriovorax TaxID=2639665 RepID=UPI003D96230D
MTLVLGIGNPFRRDDGVGEYVISHLNKRVDLKAMIINGDLSRLVDFIEGYSLVIIIDAFENTDCKSRVLKWNYSEEAPPSDWIQYSTHGIGLAEALELAQVLGKIPKKIIIYGIKGEDFSHGQGLSANVLESAKLVIKEIEKQL